MDNEEIVKEWFAELIGEEIKQELGTIANERIWANGSATDEETDMHLENIALHEKYIQFLKSVYLDVIGKEYD